MAGRPFDPARHAHVRVNHPRVPTVSTVRSELVVEAPQSLLAELLAKPIGPAMPSRHALERDFTRQIEVSGNTAEVTVHAEARAAEDAATGVLIEQGLDPADWEATGFKVSEWTRPNGEPGVSTKYTFKRVGQPTERPALVLDELLAAVQTYEPKGHLPTGDHGFIVALGDMQLGKLDGDGPAGTLARSIDCINKAAEKLLAYGQLYDIGHVHIAWLGDHIEGFVSQGGANTWRTQLTLNEQIRLTRRLMLHALLVFAPLASRLTMAAVPGNHGEAVRFNGKGVTRYDDSHDTESLIAVADAVKLHPGVFDHVDFYVPETDELSVVIDVAGTVVGHVHGHQFRPGKHFEWWKGQSFNAASPMHQVNLLLAGHLHHLHVDTDGERIFIQPPALESESTWWRHAKGTTGAPGLVLALTKDGETNLIETIR
ncbi:hypothetical protein AB0J80_36200 [Actinoplanes sp. NPDC049548]|uniref:hypothetical protein n=1 Tax=Actinoplanes sp. NPDC049548 TaxID=3155152 RepID=UPI003443B864